ncbi:hypothetical protein PtrSN002B_009652 [Pyrenophora tritici-repentis]|uniref:Uncharacterized protein n=1 Tax=Pyrenophora tritici-repentis TaxID=45151 RepID=A0A2W1DLN5_9PLEO|nr:hypothetical protein PtrM4_081570 [Pyrenophora tritici-repentis]KAI1516408.1 hypothetical protein Ptr86124_004945 [Pyrenophora tritici-repentis]KAI1536351.1 hypothetical protein PtrSN002B_009652 [Pyrenophora tritici-repentis]KAI1671374.1 hypothetical protein L13192_04731 [Pyrenophora tritici-repentis]KAI1685191.1 hypothetical protein KJE20_05475 [Pyrenophora tritici-repentis]
MYLKLIRHGQHLVLILYLAKKATHNKVERKVSLKRLFSTLSNACTETIKDEGIQQLIGMHAVNVLRGNSCMYTDEDDQIVHNLVLLADLVNMLLGVEAIVEVDSFCKRSKWSEANILVAFENRTWNSIIVLDLTVRFQ